LGERCGCGGGSSEEWSSYSNNEYQQLDTQVSSLLSEMLSMIPRECRSTAVVTPATVNSQKRATNPLSNSNPNTKGSIPSFPTSTVELIHQVIQSAHELILDEYNDIQEDYYSCHNEGWDSTTPTSVRLSPSEKIRSSRRHGNRHQYQDESFQYATNGKQGLRISEEAKETIVTALEFLAIAYAYLDCNVVYSSLFQQDGNASTSSDSGGNGNKHGNDRDGRHRKDILKALVYLFLNEQELRNENDNTAMLINTIMPSSNQDVDTIQPPTEQNPQPKALTRSWKMFQNNNDSDEDTLSPKQSRKQEEEQPQLSKLQTLALGTLSRALLCVEFIARYCSSQNILPNTATNGCAESALGINLGIEWLSCNHIRQAIWNKAIHTLVRAPPTSSRLYPLSYESTSSNDSSSIHQTKERLLGRFASISIMGFFLRTLSRTECCECFLPREGLPSDGHKELLQILEKNVSKMSKQLSNSSSMKSSSSTLNHSKMALYVSSLSLLSLVKWKLSDAPSHDDNTLVNRKVLHNLTCIAFSSESSDAHLALGSAPSVDPDETVMNDDSKTNNMIWKKMMRAVSTDVIIHLSMSRSDLLRDVIDDEGFGALVRTALAESVLFQPYLDSTQHRSQYRQIQDGNMAIKELAGEHLYLLLHLKRSFYRQFRRWMDATMNQVQKAEHSATLHVNGNNDPSGTASRILLQNLLDLGGHESFNISIGSIILLRSLLNHKKRNGQIDDSLGRDLWHCLRKNEQMLNAFGNHFYSVSNYACTNKNQQDITTSGVSENGMTIDFDWQPWICTTIDLIHLICRDDMCCQLLFISALQNDHGGLKTLFSTLRYSSYDQKGSQYDRICMVSPQYSLFCAIQLCVGSILCIFSDLDTSQLSSGDANDQDSTDNMIHHEAVNFVSIQSSIHREIVSFISQNKEYELTTIGAAIGQAMSSGITRRALCLQAALATLNDDDGSFISESMFASARLNMLQCIQSQEIVSKFEEEQRRLSIENTQLSKEREKLTSDMARRNAFFAQEITKCKVYAKHEAADLIAIEQDEKESLKRLLVKANDSIRDMKVQIQNTTEKLKVDVKKRDEEITHLQDSMQKIQKMTEAKLESKEKHIGEAKRVIEKLKGKLHTEEVKRSETEGKYKELNEAKERDQAELEGAYFKLISLAKIYDVGGQDRKRTEKQLQDDLRQAHRSIEDTTKKYNHSESQVKALHDKYKDLRRKLESAEKTIENMKKKESTRRKPMGAVDFVNSIHDESFRSSRATGKENRYRDKDRTGSKSISSSRRSNFSIMK